MQGDPIIGAMAIMKAAASVSGAGEERTEITRRPASIEERTAKVPPPKPSVKPGIGVRREGPTIPAPKEPTKPAMPGEPKFDPGKRVNFRLSEPPWPTPESLAEHSKSPSVWRRMGAGIVGFLTHPSTKAAAGGVWDALKSIARTTWSFVHGAAPGVGRGVGLAAAVVRRRALERRRGWPGPGVRHGAERLGRVRECDDVLAARAARGDLHRSAQVVNEQVLALRLVVVALQGRCTARGLRLEQLVRSKVRAAHAQRGRDERRRGHA